MASIDQLNQELIQEITKRFKAAGVTRHDCDNDRVIIVHLTEFGGFIDLDKATEGDHRPQWIWAIPNSALGAFFADHWEEIMEALDADPEL